MEQTGRRVTHQRLVARYLATLVLVPVVFAVIAAVLERFTTREFALFVWGFGSLVAWIGMSHSHARTCATSEMDPQSQPGGWLRVLPWLGLILAGGAAYVGIRDFAPTQMAQVSLGVAAVGFAFALFRGSRAILRAGSPSQAPDAPAAEEASNQP